MTDKITINDFGFSLTSEEDIKKIETDQQIEKSSLKLKRVKDKIWPLLDQLKKDPHLDTVRWPSRVSVITRLMQEIDLIISE